MKMRMSWLIRICLVWLHLVNQAMASDGIPIDVKLRAQQELNGKCLELFLDKGSWFDPGYQAPHIPSLVGVFAVGEFHSKFYCAWARKSYFSSLKEAKKKALLACESVRSAGGSPCEIFAYDNDIVYVNVHDKLDNARALFESGDTAAAGRVMAYIDFDSLSREEKGEYYYLSGLLQYDPERVENKAEYADVIRDLHLAWSSYGNVDAALEEGNQRMMKDPIDQNWQAIRDAYEFFLRNASDGKKSEHPEVAHNLKRIEPYVAQAQKKQDRQR